MACCSPAPSFGATEKKKPIEARRFSAPVGRDQAKMRQFTPRDQAHLV